MDGPDREERAMIREELVFVATCDISGHVRGKVFPARELPGRLQKGIGWTGSNLMMSPAGPIWDTPFGTAGDLMIVPDPAAEVRVDFADGSAPEHFFLGDIRTTDGKPWECCPRNFLRRAVAELEEAAGLRVIAAFEQEFLYTGVEDRPGDAYALGAFRRQGNFGETFIAALRAAGPLPDSFLPEYGPRQFEVTVLPQPALTAADHAVVTREMARATAHRLGRRAVFSPKPAPDNVGSGVHIHMSLWDGGGRPVTYSPGEALDLGKPAQHFAAGILHHLPAICALTAPSPVSYLRLVPNAWAPTKIDLVRQDRSACLRIAPVLRPPAGTRSRGNSISNSALATPRRARIWRWAPSCSPAPTASAGRCRCRLAPRPRRCPRRSTPRSTISKRARRWRAGSGRCTATPICASSASRLKRSPAFCPPSCAPTTPTSISSPNPSVPSQFLTALPFTGQAGASIAPRRGRNQYPASVSIRLRSERPRFEAENVVEHDRSGGSRVGDAGDMRGDEDARVMPERVTRRQRLVAEHIEGRRAELAAVERRDQIVLDQVTAAPGIDKAGAVGQTAKRAFAEDALGLRRQRQQADEDFARREQLRQTVLAGEYREGRVGSRSPAPG